MVPGLVSSAQLVAGTTVASVPHESKAAAWVMINTDLVFISGTPSVPWLSGAWPSLPTMCHQITEGVLTHPLRIGNFSVRYVDANCISMTLHLRIAYERVSDFLPHPRPVQGSGTTYLAMNLRSIESFQRQTHRPLNDSAPQEATA